MPPRIHGLLRLAELAGIELPEEQSQFFSELSGYYIQSRYPEEIIAMASKITRAIAAATPGKTEEAIQWLFSMLK